jgi:hypothetical protein
MSGIFGSVMDLFKPQNAAAQASQAQPTQTENGQQAQAAQPSMQPAKVEAPAKEEVSPLDGFKDLWSNPVQKEGDPKPFNPSQIFNLDPNSMKEAVGKIDFASSVTPEQLQAISAGGEDAVKAFAQAMNSVAQTTMTMSTTAAAKMIEQAMTGASGALDSRVDRQVKLHQVSSQLQETNPALNHPAAAPILEGIKQQLVNKYPTASSAEITKLAGEYLSNFASLAAGKKEEAAQPTSPDQATDWMKYMGAGE